MSTAEKSFADRLSRVCTLYNDGRLSGSGFILAVLTMDDEISKAEPGCAIAGQDWNSLIKRAENSVGRHFCKINKECDKQCMYVRNKVSWQSEIGQYKPFDAVDIESFYALPASPSKADRKKAGNDKDSAGVIFCAKDAFLKDTEDSEVRSSALFDTLYHMKRYSLRPATPHADDHGSIFAVKSGDAAAPSEAERKGEGGDARDHPLTQDQQQTFDHMSKYSLPTKSTPTEETSKEEKPLPRKGSRSALLALASQQQLQQHHDSLYAQPSQPFKAVPVIDFSLPTETVAKLIGDACRQVGFFYLVNHGVDKSMVEQQFAMARNFFSLPSHAKRGLDNKLSKGGVRGYFALGTENLNTTRSEMITKYHGDFKEGFDVGVELTAATRATYTSFALCGDNLWPEEKRYNEELDLTGFRQQCLDYFAEMTALGTKLMRCFALALGLPAEYFEQFLSKPVCTLRMLHYPPMSHAGGDKRMLGCGSHTDYGCCTILLQDAIGGLQVRNSKMQWIHAPPVPNSYVINIGDMMSRWTNKTFSSTVHRVVNNSAAKQHRYSVPFFFNPSFDATIACIPGTQQQEQHFPPETCERILMQRYEETFDHLAAQPP